MTIVLNISSYTTADTREGGSDVGGVVAGVIVSVLLFIGATLGILATIWLMRRCRCALGMFFHGYSVVCALQEKDYEGSFLNQAL